MVVTVLVPGMDGKNMAIDVCSSEAQLGSVTVQELKNKTKAKIDSCCTEGTRTVSLGLAFGGRELDRDSSVLSEYGIKHMSILSISSISQTL